MTPLCRTRFSRSPLLFEHRALRREIASPMITKMQSPIVVMPQAPMEKRPPAPDARRWLAGPYTGAAAAAATHQGAPPKDDELGSRGISGDSDKRAYVAKDGHKKVEAVGSK